MLLDWGPAAFGPTLLINTHPNESDREVPHLPSVKHLPPHLMGNRMLLNQMPSHATLVNLEPFFDKLLHHQNIWTRFSAGLGQLLNAVIGNGYSNEPLGRRMAKNFGDLAAQCPFKHFLPVHSLKKKSSRYDIALMGSFIKS